MRVNIDSAILGAINDADGKIRAAKEILKQAKEGEQKGVNKSEDEEHAET